MDKKTSVVLAFVLYSKNAIAKTIEARNPMLKKLWMIIFLVLFGCSNKGISSVTSVNLNNFDKKEVAFYKKFSIKEDAVYTISIGFYAQENDETQMGLMSLLGFYRDKDKILMDAGTPIYTYFKITDSDGKKIAETAKKNPTTTPISYGRVAFIGRTYIKKGDYKIMFYAKQEHLIFAKTNATLNIGNVPLGK